LTTSVQARTCAHALSTILPDTDAPRFLPGLARNSAYDCPFLRDWRGIRLQGCSGTEGEQGPSRECRRVENDEKIDERDRETQNYRRQKVSLLFSLNHRQSRFITFGNRDSITTRSRSRSDTIVPNKLYGVCFVGKIFLYELYFLDKIIFSTSGNISIFQIILYHENTHMLNNSNRTNDSNIIYIYMVVRRNLRYVISHNNKNMALV